MDYCSLIWGQADISRLVKLQKLALRTMADVPNRTPSHGLFEQFRILPLLDKIHFRTVSMVHKAIHGKTPNYISDMFQQVSKVNSRSTRTSVRGDLYIPPAKLSIQAKTLRFTGATLYNKCDPEIRNTDSSSVFKGKYMKHFFENF